MSYSILNINPVPFDVGHFIVLLMTTEELDYKIMKYEWSLYMKISEMQCNSAEDAADKQQIILLIIIQATTSYTMPTKTTVCFKIDVTSGIVKVVCYLIWANFSKTMLKVIAAITFLSCFNLNVKFTELETGTASRGRICWNYDNNFYCEATAWIKITSIFK